MYRDRGSACTADVRLSGDLVATISDGECNGWGSSGLAVNGIDFANGGTIATDRLAFSLRLVNWVPSDRDEVLEQVAALVDVSDIEQGRRWGSVDPLDTDPAGCVFDGSQTGNEVDGRYLSGTVRCDRALIEYSDGGEVFVDGEAMVGGLGPVPMSL